MKTITTQHTITIFTFLLALFSFNISNGQESSESETLNSKSKAADEATTESKEIKGNPDFTILEFVGSGAIQKSLDSGDDLPAATGLGVILEEHHVTEPILMGNINKVQFFGQINVASTDDSLQVKYGDNNQISNTSQFGESLLRPLVGKNAVNLELRAFFTGEEKNELSKVNGSNRKKGLAHFWISGVRVKYIGSNRIWSDSLNSVKATTNTFKAGIFHDFINHQTPDHNSDYNVILGVGAIYTSVRGDLGLSDNTSFRQTVLGSDISSQWGTELFTEFRLKNIKAEFSYTFFKDGQNAIPGFSGGRMITTIGFVGGFPVKLKK